MNGVLNQTVVDAIQARYREAVDGVEARGFSATENVVLTTLLGHCSVRSFLADDVSDATLRALIAAAQSASSSSNFQAWSVIAIRDAARKEAFSQLCGGQPYVKRAPLFLAWLADLTRLEQVSAQHGLPAEGLDFLETLIVALVDVGLAAQNAVVAAEAMGLGVVYIGAMRNHMDEAAALLKLPPRVMPVFGMCLGYPDPSRPTAVRPRLPQAAVLFNEEYDTAAQAEPLKRYDETMRDYYAERGIKAPGSWSLHSAERVAHAASLDGRDKLQAIITALGFPMK